MRFRSYSDSHSDRAIEGLRVALCLLVMDADRRQLERAERTLAWMAEFRPARGAYREALDEFRVMVQADEDEEGVD